MGIATELVKFRKALVQPKKNANNPKFKSGYVDFDSVVDAIDTALASSGADLTYIQGIQDGYVYTELMSGDESKVIPGAAIISAQMQKGGTWVESISPQAFGSGLTYAKRYSLATAFGIASEVDDDGNIAQETYQNNNANSQQNNNRQPFNGGAPERKANLNSQFGSLRKRIMDRNNLDDEQLVFDQINNNFGLNIASFGDFASLEEGMKQNIVNLMEGWLS